MALSLNLFAWILAAKVIGCSVSLYQKFARPPLLLANLSSPDPDDCCLGADCFERASGCSAASQSPHRFLQPEARSEQRNSDSSRQGQVHLALLVIMGVVKALL